MFRPLQTAFLLAERFISAISAAALFAIMLIATADVAMRYLFNAPFIWSHDVIRLYLVPAVVYLTVSHAFAQNAHISVDLLQYHIPRRARHACAAVSGACVAALFAVIAEGTAARAWEEYVEGDILAGLIAWRVWPSSALVAAGSCLLALRATVHAVAHLRAALGGVEHLPVPALSTDEDHGSEVRQ